MSKDIRTKAIVALLVIVLVVALVPFEMLLGKPSIFGAVVTKVFIQAQENTWICNTTVVEGWNLVSVGCFTADTSIDNILATLYDNYTSAHRYNHLDASDPWKVYNPHMPAWVVQDLDDITNEQGFWLYTNVSSDIIQVNGTITVPYRMGVVPGWMMTGYPSFTTADPATAFIAVTDSYTIVWAYNASNQSWLYWNNELDEGTLETVEPGMGFWFNFTQSDDLWLV